MAYLNLDTNTVTEHVLRVDLTEAGYEQDKAIVRDIRFHVEAGELVGLIGPNGAGKSTTIKTILGLMNHVKGTIQFGGSRKRYAYVPEQPVLYEYFTLWEHLRLAASAFGIEEREFEAKAEELLVRFRLSPDKHRYPVKFSKGMQQKLMLIIGFMLEPDIYIIDEPFVGLDPRATRDFLELLQLERERGAGVLMCTHMLDTAERICNRFVLINNGRSVADGSIGEVRAAAGCPADAPLFDCFHALT
ncbi:ABC transporter ATP-binding protein [Paenibacillus tarimensis]